MGSKKKGQGQKGIRETTPKKSTDLAKAIKDEANSIQKKMNEDAQRIRDNPSQIKTDINRIEIPGKVREQLNSRNVLMDKASDLAKTIKDEADEVQERMNEDAQSIRDNLKSDNLKEKFNQIKTNLKKIETPAASFIWVPILIGIMTYLVCCFSLCGENDSCGPILLTFPFLISKKALCWCLLQIINLLKKVPCEEDTKLLSPPPVKEKITELAKVFQEEETQDNLLTFWIPIVLGVLFGILIIGGAIAGFMKWMINRQNNQTLLRINDEGNWVYGSNVQERAALTAEEGKKTRVGETK